MARSRPARRGNRVSNRHPCLRTEDCLKVSNSHRITSYPPPQPLLGSQTTQEGRGFYLSPHKSEPAPKYYSLAVAMALARGRKAPKGHCVPPHHHEATRLPLLFLHLSTSLLPMQCVVMHRERVTTSNIKNPVNCYMGKGGNKFAAFYI